MSAANQDTLHGEGGFSHAKQANLDLAARCNAELYRTFNKQIYAAISYVQNLLQIAFTMLPSGLPGMVGA
jgi:hypothetical protein